MKKPNKQNQLISLNVAESHLYSVDIDMSRAVNSLMDVYSDTAGDVAQSVQNIRFELGKLRQQIRKEIVRVADLKK